LLRADDFRGCTIGLDREPEGLVCGFKLEAFGGLGSCTSGDSNELMSILQCCSNMLLAVKTISDRRDGP
jgi:hypothetical protein